MKPQFFLSLFILFSNTLAFAQDSKPAAPEATPAIATEFTRYKILNPNLLSCKEPPFCGTIDPTKQPHELTDVLEFLGEGTFKHDPKSVIRLSVTVTEPLVVGLESQTAEGVIEVYRRQQLQSGANQVYWLLEERIGKSPDPRFFEISFGGNVRSEYSNLRLELIDGSTLSNEQVLQATQFLPLQIELKRPNLKHQKQQTAQVVLPRELHRRFPGQTIMVTLGGESQELLIDPIAPLKQEFFFHQFPFDLSNLSLGDHLIEAQIQDESGNTLLPLGAETFELLDEIDPSGASFEVPFRDVVDYVPFFQNEDLRLIVLPQDQLSKEEPYGFETARHEVLDYTISLKSLQSREHVGWRVPGFGHFAEAGFQQLSIGSQPVGHMFFLTAENAFERQVLAYGVSVDNAPFGAPINNPLYAPSSEWTGSVLPDDAVRLMNSGAQKYGSSYVMLTEVQVNNGPARTIASVSNDLRTWVETGIVPALDRKPALAKHLFLTKKDSFFFLIRDREVWFSQDPFRSWSKIDVPLPNWANVRLVQVGEQWYYFGIERLNNKNMVRWQKCAWVMNSQGFFIPEIQSSP